MVRKLSRAGSTNSPRPRLRSLSHPNSLAPGPPRPALTPCRPRLPALQSCPGRRRDGEGGEGSPRAEAADDSTVPGGDRSPARAAGGNGGAPRRRGLRAAGGGGAASVPGCGGTGGAAGEGGLAVVVCSPWGAGSSAPAAASPLGLRGPKENMTNTPAPSSQPLSCRPTPRRSSSSRHFRVRRRKAAGWETCPTAWLPSTGDKESGDTAVLRFCNPEGQQSGMASCTCERLKMPGTQVGTD